MRQILLADDSLSIRQMIRAMLEPEGYFLIEATDGVEALAAMRMYTEPLVVLLDYQMPNMDGEDVLREVIGAGPPLSTHEYLVVSANASTFPDSFIDLLRHLSLRVIPKPFTRETLVTAVAQAAERLDAPPPEPLPNLPDA
ncbi:MAG TPA: response regulator [Ktedonobacterales bacterium]|nr:response regulator [Ktedonobacterales bacterium]